jgi:hypothetical protein
MNLRLTPHYIFALALLTVALLASSAHARPPAADLRSEAPTSSLAGTHAPQQDLRGEMARSAATDPRPFPEAAVAPAAPKALPSADTDGGVDTWLVLFAAFAGAGVVAAGTAGAVRSRRPV